VGPDCVHLQWYLEVAKALGPTFAILAAALAWLVNRTLTWAVWSGERFVVRLEMMNALYSDIATNLESERAYSNVDDGRKFLARLAARLPDAAPLIPYVAVQEKNVVFNEASSDLRALPPDIVLAVVKYYNASAGLSRQLADFRSEAFLAIGRERQESVFIDAYRVGNEVCQLGEAALKQLKSRRQIYDKTRLLFFTAIGVIGFMERVLARVRQSGRQVAQCGGKMGFIMRLTSGESPAITIYIT
jgi:hypothetical protein